MTANINEIREADWSIRLGAPGEVVTGADDVQQCLELILRTPKGSVPLRPEFGCDAFTYLDAPISEAIPNIKRAIFDAAEMWEPRAKILGVSNQADESNLQFTVTWAYAGITGDSIVSYDRA